MLESISPQTLAPSGLQSEGFLPGLDLMASLQVLLIQDYDSQLKHLAQTMKAQKNVKQAYRKDIQALHQALLKQTIKIKDKEYVRVEGESAKAAINKRAEYVPQLETGGISTFSQGEDKLVENKRWKDEGDIGQAKGSGDVVEKEKLQQKIELLNQKLDGFNEQSELTSLQLQTLTNQRKVAFETLSNLIAKESETLTTIVRNLKG